MKTRKRRISLALAAMMLSAMALGAGAADAGERSIFLPEGIELTAPDTAAAEGYALYENEHVKFSMEVPAEYEVTEPYENVMLVTGEDPTDFQVHAEYAFATVDNAHFLYDAQDFADLIEADKKQLTGWVGAEDIEVLGTGWGEVSGKRCYVCAFTMNGGDATGGLYIFDGQGDFGCYCVTALINEKSEKAALYGEQLQHMVETFAVTGPYQMEGYTLYEREEKDVPVTFFVKDRVGVSDDRLGIYPVDGVYSDANVYVHRSSWETGDGMEMALASAVRMYIEDYGGHYTAQNSSFLLGRYSYDMAEVEYEESDKTYTRRTAVFLADGCYWQVSATYTAEYADAVNDAFSDVLFSLRVGTPAPVLAQDAQPAADGGAAPAEAAPDTAGSAAGPALTQEAGSITTPNVVEQIVNSIESQPGFGSSASFYEPLGCGWYLPDAGRLILAEYEVSDSSNGFDDWYVCTDAWLVKDGGAVLLGRNQLYREVGGNSGSTSIVQKDGVVYVELECHLWEGDRFNNYYVYLPVDEQAGAFGQGVYMEAHGTVGQEDSGEYIIDGEYWPRSDFDIARSEYEQMLTVNIIQGPEDFGAKPLDDLPQSYPDEDIFAVRTDVW